MNGRFLLDTNIIIAFFANDTSVKENLAKAVEVFVPSMVVGELYYGAYKSSRRVENVSRIEEFAVSNTVLVCDAETAQEYGRVKNGLRAKGRPIPENDIWIAALAKQYDLTVATQDMHFKEVENLLLEMW